jgi:import receptor subunit TOM70
MCVALFANIIPEPTAKKPEEPSDEIPDVDEATVGQLDEEVGFDF